MNPEAKPEDTCKVAVAQIAPVWLNRNATIEKMIGYIERAAKNSCALISFGEALIPGYPFWTERTDGARFNSEIQKEFFSHYLSQAVQPEAGDLELLCEAAKVNNITVVTGTIERAANRGGHSLYCTLMYIDSDGEIKSAHRKLMPTYDERLVWSPGDGHGLRTHSLPPFTVGCLNCWENWMPLPRTALYAQGENLHVAVWPGSKRNTHDITRFIAKESRSFVISVSGLMRKTDIPKDFPHSEFMMSNSEETLADGGSCIAAPDGSWVIEPVVDSEDLLIAELDYDLVRRERQNFDPTGHYCRPDVTKLTVNRERQSSVEFENESE